MNKIERHKQILIEMHDLYQRKNHDYGDAFGEAYKELGAISGVTRIYDKFKRLITLIKSESKVKDETIDDTLIDLANYCIMLKMEIENEC